MRKFLALVLCLTLALAAGAQQKTKLDARASVVFPATAEQTEVQGTRVWVCGFDSLSREKGVMIVVRLEAKQMGLSAKELEKNKTDKTFLESFAKDMEGSMKGKKLVATKSLKLNGLNVLELRFEASDATVDVPFRYVVTHAYFERGAIYCLSVNTNEANAYPEMSAGFFNSFSLQ